jgi:metallo-beta-lactamase class B
MKLRCAVAASVLMALAPAGAEAQPRVPLTVGKDLAAPFPGFRVVGNLYYVGTYDLGCYLIDTGAGLILINTGGPGSYPLIKANIEALGFKTSDIKILTATHAHWDHVSDLASFKKDAPAAKVYIDQRDAAAVESGDNGAVLGAYAIPYTPREYRNNPDGGKGGYTLFDPVKVDVKTKPGDHIKLGNTDMTTLQAYGHTPGANSFRFAVRDGGRTYRVYLVNTDTLNPGMKLLGTPAYPGVVADFEKSLAEQATYKPDIWLSSHAFQFNMHELYKPGDPYKPARFANLALYKAKIAEDRAAFEKELALERAEMAARGAPP